MYTPIMRQREIRLLDWFNQIRVRVLNPIKPLE
jgi:hypothetical protein